MKKKVLILNPYTCRDYYSDITVQWKKRTDLLHPPIFLAYIAAYLRANKVDVYFLDAAGEGLGLKENIRRVSGLNPDLIITKTHFSTWEHERRLFSDIKKRLKVSIVSVGVHPTLAADELLGDGVVDFAVRNEPELTCLNIAEGLDPRGVPGISYRDNGDIVHNQDRKLLEDLDVLPFPARDLFPHKRYRLSSYKKMPMTVVFTGRGCYFNCIHCGQQVVWGNRRRRRSAQNIIREIEELQRMGYREISFEDQIVECDDRMMEIAGALKRLKFSWKFGTRADLVNEEALKVFKNSGCYEVFLGVESGEQESLDWLQKRMDIGQIKDAFQICRKNKLPVNATFMIGLPQENKESVIKTIELAKELDPDYATFYAFTPLPKTPAFDFYKSNKLFVKEDLHSIDFQQVCVRTRYLGPEEIERLIDDAYRQFYFRPKYIFKMLKRIDSISLMGAITSCCKLIASLFKKKPASAGQEVKDRILAEARREYQVYETVTDKKEALKKANYYRKKGFYFSVPVRERDGWRVYIR